MPIGPHIRVRPELEAIVIELSRITGLRRDFIRNLALAIGLESIVISLKLNPNLREWRAIYVSTIKRIALDLDIDLNKLIPSGKVYGVDLNSIDVVDLTSTRNIRIRRGRGREKTVAASGNP